MVYVLDIDGNPIMPTNRHGKVRHLLKEGKAKVIRKDPFTIQLLYKSTTYKQEITLGVDAGSKHIGLSASTKKQEVYASDVQLRVDIVDNISTRRQTRTARRNRKTRYRKARFNNRIKRKHKGWLAPSIQQKIDCHLKQIEDLHKILPVAKIVVETASFDIQKIKNPEIQGEEYQQGDQLGFWNVREFVLFRDGHTCQHCKGKSKDPILNVHHIESRKTGGNAPNNLITLCETCHKEYHSLPPEKQAKWGMKRGMKFKDATFMGIMRWSFYGRLKETYPDVRMTFGYLTKNTRIHLGLEKEHYNDAYCIAGNLTAVPLKEVVFKKKVRRHNRQIHKFNISKGGKRKLNQSPYVVKGFRLFDKVTYQGQECFISGRRTTGSFALKTFDWKKVTDSVTYKKISLVQKRGGYLSTRKERAFLPPLKELVSSPMDL